MNPIRQRVVDDFVRVSGRHDDPELYGGPAGDPGLLGPGSLSWEIHGDLGAVSLAGVAAIVLELLHPSVIAGVQDLSRYREDPFRRARTSLGYVLGTTFGNTVAATALIERVRRIHARIEGTRPDGVPYRALDPELLGWVHTSIPWMILQTFERTRRPLTPAERDRYLAEQAIIGRMAGATDLPETWPDLEAYVAAMRGKLAVTEQTRAFLSYLLDSPFAPALPAPMDRAAQRFQVLAGMHVAPEWARDLAGLEAPPAVRRWFGPYLRTSARTIRWAFGVPPYLALARARAA